MLPLTKSTEKTTVFARRRTATAMLVAFSTRTGQAATTVLREFTGRWSIEESNQGSKQHLGFEEPPGWSLPAVERTAPIAMLLYSLIVVWFAQFGVA